MGLDLFAICPSMCTVFWVIDEHRFFVFHEFLMMTPQCNRLFA